MTRPPAGCDHIRTWFHRQNVNSLCVWSGESGNSMVHGSHIRAIWLMCVCVCVCVIAGSMSAF